MKPLAVVTLLAALMPSAIEGLKAHTWLHADHLKDEPITIQTLDSDEKIGFDNVNDYFSGAKARLKVESEDSGAEDWGNGHYDRVWNSNADYEALLGFQEFRTAGVWATAQVLRLAYLTVSTTAPLATTVGAKGMTGSSRVLGSSREF